MTAPSHELFILSENSTPRRLDERLWDRPIGPGADPTILDATAAPVAPPAQVSAIS